MTAASINPLIDVRGLPCWPSQADFSQLADGNRIGCEGWDFESHWERRKAAMQTLRVGADFDLVVLGVGLGAIPEVAGDLLAHDQRWRDLVGHVTTVATQAFQIWMREDMAALGWDQRQTAVSAFYHPFDTWADMRHLISEESWLVRPRAIAYFCSALPDPQINGTRLGHFAADSGASQYMTQQRERVRRNAIDFLNRDIAHLWPGAARPGGGFRWELLMTADESAHAQRCAATAAAQPQPMVQRPTRGVALRCAILDRERESLGPLRAIAAQNHALPHLAARQYLR